MQAKLKSEYRHKTATLFSGVEFNKQTWTYVPRHAETEALGLTDILEIQDLPDEQRTARLEALGRKEEGKKVEPSDLQVVAADVGNHDLEGLLTTPESQETKEMTGDEESAEGEEGTDEKSTRSSRSTRRKS